MKARIYQSLKAISILPNIWRFIFSISPKYSIILVLLCFFQSILPVIMIWISKLIIDNIVKKAEFGETLKLITLELALAIGLSVTSLLLNAIREILKNLITTNIRQKLAKKATELDISFLRHQFY